MSQKIGVIDYGYAGNIFNIKKVFEAASSDVDLRIIKDKEGIKCVDKLVIPGVGTYKGAVKELSEFAEVVKSFLTEKPTLGICLGMQILSHKGFEFGETDGLRLIEGEVRMMPVKGRIPHIGWASVEKIKESVLLRGVTEEDRFYFMHSYELINYKDVVGLSDYCDHKFVSVIERDHIFGVQFHPEKSRKSGLKIINNFINY